MRQEIITIYNFDDLSPEAQRRAWDNGPDFSGDYGSEYIATLRAFEKIFDIDVYRYNVDPFYRVSYSYVKAGAACDCPEGDALRLARYMWNNYAEYIRKGKYYEKLTLNGGKFRRVKRYSKITFKMDDCPLTGYGYDCDILQPVIDCLTYKRFFDSIDELFNECLSGFFHAWQAEIEYCNSFEYFADMARENGWEYYETGEMYK